MATAQPAAGYGVADQRFAAGVSNQRAARRISAGAAFSRVSPRTRSRVRRISLSRKPSFLSAMKARARASAAPGEAGSRWAEPSAWRNTRALALFPWMIRRPRWSARWCAEHRRTSFSGRGFRLRRAAAGDARRENLRCDNLARRSARGRDGERVDAPRAEWFASRVVAVVDSRQAHEYARRGPRGLCRPRGPCRPRNLCRPRGRCAGYGNRGGRCVARRTGPFR